MEIKDIIKPAITIKDTASLKDAVSLMIEEKVNALLVVDDDEKLIGEITVSELLTAIVPDYLDDDVIAAHFVSNEVFQETVEQASDKQVQFFMSKKITPVTMHEELMTIAVKAISGQHVRIPVIDDEGKPIAIISRRGLKHIIGDALNIEDAA